MNKIITSEIVVAYSLCPRKAFLLLEGKEKGTPHEYVEILEEQRRQNRDDYLNTLCEKNMAIAFTEENMRNRSDVLIKATLKSEDLQAYCAVLTKVESNSSTRKFSYEPTIVVGTHKITKQKRLELTFAGYVIGKKQNEMPRNGKIVEMYGHTHKMKLENTYKTLVPDIGMLQEWVGKNLSEKPSLILNNHCPYCPFQVQCERKAKEEDHLSLLDRVTPKVVQQYEKKGIFTVQQLSYLFKPRRKKKSKNHRPAAFKLELQALAIRTGKIYLQEIPEIQRHEVELFLDIEGNPDRNTFYLMGLNIVKENDSQYISFWADKDVDEEGIFNALLQKINQYPNTPIYHYGSYETQAIKILASRYKKNCDSIQRRFVNVISFIFGKIYFPVNSNSLKDIGRFLGVEWTSSQASGLQSLFWRHKWEERQSLEYKQMLITYNQEDCLALIRLVEKLVLIKTSADTLTEVDFANQPKKYATELGKQVHDQFEIMLRFAHAKYDEKKIKFRQDPSEKKTDRAEKIGGTKKGYQGQRRVRPRAMKRIEVPPGGFCPKHVDETLKTTTKRAKRLIIDLVLTRNGIRKTITEYIGFQGYCSKCGRFYSPPDIRKFGSTQLYGNGFKAWFVYHRVDLRLPYERIGDLIEEQFNEKITRGYSPTFLKDLSDYYAETEKNTGKKLLEGPFIHCDETEISIRGTTHYVWVFTDGKYVLFKLSKSREATIVHKFLTDYKGILISDFYPGYDSVKCQQQKCWVHLIRDLNNDLWSTPFDTEYEEFILIVRNLIIPIMEAIQKYGLKKRNLYKFRKSVDTFYKNTIDDRIYRSELVIKYQNRFSRYRDSLFTFLEHDGIPWHNNQAERAIRHLAIQRDISKNFYESVTHAYLSLLGIRQTCRFQDKSFFKFLFSGETDLDQFKGTKR